MIGYKVVVRTENSDACCITESRIVPGHVRLASLAGLADMICHKLVHCAELSAITDRVFINKSVITCVIRGSDRAVHTGMVLDKLVLRTEDRVTHGAWTRRVISTTSIRRSRRAWDAAMIVDMLVHSTQALLAAV